MRRRRFILSSRCSDYCPFPKFVIRRSKLGQNLGVLTELAAAVQKLQMPAPAASPFVITSIYRWRTALRWLKCREVTRSTIAGVKCAASFKFYIVESWKTAKAASTARERVQHLSTGVSELALQP